jgi:uncharacterized protein YecE (DUF72 family)
MYRQRMAVHEPLTMNEKPSILIGAWGFDHDGWTPAFYPEELPNDWRFAYYSNWFRALLLPAETPLRFGRAALEEWTQDADSEFRFVVELPLAAVDAALAGKFQSLDEYLRLIEPLGGHTAGFLLSSAQMCHASDRALNALFTRLKGRPACVAIESLESLPTACTQRLTALGAGVLWEPAREPAPVAGGALLVVRTNADAPADQRQLLDAVTAWQGAGGQAAVFFEHPAMARQARLVAELLDV